MREYQRKAVDIAVGDWDPWTKFRNENYLFVAPTGSGKTRIFIECARLENTQESIEAHYVHLYEGAMDAAQE